MASANSEDLISGKNIACKKEDENQQDVKDNVEEAKEINLSHQEALAFVDDGILDIIHSDPLLNFLPPGVTLEELNSLLALEHGRAISVVVKRADEESYSIVVEQKATVMDLKKAIQRHVTLKQKRQGCDRTISWRYVWKTYWLYYDGQKLMQDNKPLKDYGIRNNSELTFMKRLKMR